MRNWAPATSGATFTDLSGATFEIPLSTVIRLAEGLRYDYLKARERFHPEETAEERERAWEAYVQHHIDRDLPK